MTTAPKIQTATLVTSHVWQSSRRAGFHWIADSLLRRGWHVNFVTGYSMYDHLKSDYRKNFIGMNLRNRPVTHSEKLTLLVNWPILRPAGLPSELLNQITYPAASLYRFAASRALKKMVAESTLVVMESTYEIMIAAALRKCAPQARFVYRVSDDLATRNTHPAAIDAEIAALHLFDLVSLPGPVLLPRFGHYHGTKVQLHGIPTRLYARDLANPYERGGTNAIFSGNNLLDQNVLARLAAQFPQVHFHIIGPFERKTTQDNVTYYGEVPYERTIPFVVHADIGLNILTVAGFEESNKMQQYRFCGLPVVVNGERSQIVGDRHFYKNGDAQEAIAAFEAALQCGKDPKRGEQVRSWDNLVDDLLGDMGNSDP